METTYVSIRGWMDKEDVLYTHTHTHTQEYYPTTRKKTVLPFVTTGLNLEGVTLSEISLTEKDKYLYVESKKAELGEIVGRWLPGAGEVGKWGDIGHGVQTCS